MYTFIAEQDRDLTAEFRALSEPSAVYRFWSGTLGSHFYTISEAERDFIMETWPDVWAYEGVAYYAYTDDSQPGVAAVYRFWSGTLGSHFYTICEAERDFVMETWPYAWTYEGVAFYAYPQGSQPEGTGAVYRFWSGSLGSHFYTISEAERDYVLATWPDVWAYEGIAWYAWPPSVDAPVAIDDLVSVSLSATRFDLATGRTRTLMTIENASQTAVEGPLWIVVTSIGDPGITLVGSSGTTASGYQYIDVTDQLDDGWFRPGESISKWLYFENPLRLWFDFTYSTYGMI